MDNILDIVYEYSINGRILDDTAIEKIISIAKKEFNLNNVHDIERRKSFPITKHSTIAAYNHLDQSIVLYPAAIKRDFLLREYKSKLKTENELNRVEKCFRKNLHMVFIILHELEHANQFMHQKDSSLEMQLVNIELGYIYDIGNTFDCFYGATDIEKLAESFKHYKIYKNNYRISLAERLANANALLKIREMTKKIGSSKLEELYDSLLLTYYMSRYDSKDDSPTKRFFKAIERDHLLTYILIKHEDLSYEDRIKFGLNLTSDEYKANEELVKLKRR